MPLAALCNMASDYECPDYQSFSLARSRRYVGSFTFRDQLDWPGAARVLAARPGIVDASLAPFRPDRPHARADLVALVFAVGRATGPLLAHLNKPMFGMFAAVARAIAGR